MARRPVVGYRHGALPELIDDGETGFLVPDLDLAGGASIASAFLPPTRQDRPEFGETARERSLQLFSRTFSRIGSTPFMSD